MPCGLVQAFDGFKGPKRPHRRSLDGNPSVPASLREMRSGTSYAADCPAARVIISEHRPSACSADCLAAAFAGANER